MLCVWVFGVRVRGVATAYPRTLSRSRLGSPNVNCGLHYVNCGCQLREHEMTESLFQLVRKCPHQRGTTSGAHYGCTNVPSVQASVDWPSTVDLRGK